MRRWFTPDQIAHSRETHRRQWRLEWTRATARGVIVVAAVAGGLGSRLGTEWPRQQWPVAALVVLAVLEAAVATAQLPLDVWQARSERSLAALEWAAILVSSLVGLAGRVLLQSCVVLGLMATIRWFDPWWPPALAASVGWVAAWGTFGARGESQRQSGTPLTTGALRTRLVGLASRADVDLDLIRVVETGRWDGRHDAAVVGFGRHRRLILTQNLADQVDVAEAVVAHEFSHVARRHDRSDLALALALVSATIGALVAVERWPSLLGRLDVTSLGDPPQFRYWWR